MQNNPFGVHPRTLDMKIFLGEARVAYLEKVRGDLKERKLYQSGLLYRGFEARRIPVLLSQGKDTANDLCCVAEPDLEEALTTGNKVGDVFSYARENDNPALVVYEENKLIHEGGFVYRLPEDLTGIIVAIYKLVNLDVRASVKRKGLAREQCKFGSGKIEIKPLDEYCLREARLK